MFTGGVEVGTAFSKLAFDHMIFTGATSVGRHIMRAAADNLVPVTLELGGKSPTIIGRSADKAKAGQRIALGKMMNAGQICLAPDYLLVAKDQEAEMIEGVKAGVASAVSDACSPMMITPRWSTAAIMTGCRAISPTRAKRVRS